MTSYPPSAVRCDVIRSSFRSNNAATVGGDVTGSGNSRRRAIPWLQLEPAMKRRKEMFTTRGDSDSTSSTSSTVDDVINGDHDVHHGFVFNPVDVNFRSPMTMNTPYSTLTRHQRWTIDASSNVGSFDPYPIVGGGSSPNVGRPQLLADPGKPRRSGTSFRRSKSASGVNGVSQSSSSSAQLNHCASTRRTTKSDSESEIGNVSGGATQGHKGPKRSGSWLFRSLFGRQSESKTVANGKGPSDLWIDLPIDQTTVDTSREMPISIDDQVSMSSKHQAAAAASGRRIDDIPLLRRKSVRTSTTSSGPVRGVHFPGFEVHYAIPRLDNGKPVAVAPTSTTQNHITNITGVGINCFEARGPCSPLPMSLSFSVESEKLDDPMELDLSAFDAAIATLRKSTSESAALDHNAKHVDGAPVASEDNVRTSTTSGTSLTLNTVSESDFVRSMSSPGIKQLLGPSGLERQRKPALPPKPLILTKSFRNSSVVGGTTRSDPSSGRSRSTSQPGGHNAQEPIASGSSIPMTAAEDDTVSAASDWKSSSTSTGQDFVDLLAADCSVQLQTERLATSQRSNIEHVTSSVSYIGQGCESGSLGRLTSGNEDASQHQPQTGVVDYEQLVADALDKETEPTSKTLTTEQWLDSLHRKNKFRISGTERSHLVSRLETIDRVPSSNEVFSGRMSTGSDVESFLRRGVTNTAREGVHVTESHFGTPPDWIPSVYSDDDDQSSMTSDNSRPPVERRHRTRTSHKSASFLSRVRRAMFSGFGSFIGRNNATDGDTSSSSSRSHVVSVSGLSSGGHDAHSSFSSVETAGVGGGSSISVADHRPSRSRDSSMNARFSSSRCVSQDEYDRMSELEKLAVLAEKMAFEKQKSVVAAAASNYSITRPDDQHNTKEHLEELPPPNSFIFSSQKMGGSLTPNGVQRSKSCHNMHGVTVERSTPKFLPTPTTAVDFDEIVARFASVRMCADSSLPVVTSKIPQCSASKMIIDSQSPVIISSTIEPDVECIHNRNPQTVPGEMASNGFVEDHRRISMTSTLSSSSSSSGFGSLRRPTASSGCLPSSSAGSQAANDDDDRNSTDRSKLELRKIDTSRNYRFDSTRYQLDRPEVAVADVGGEPVRRPLPTMNSFTCDDVTSTASRSLALQFFQRQAMTNQPLISSAGTSCIVDGIQRQLLSTDSTVENHHRNNYLFNLVAAQMRGDDDSNLRPLMTMPPSSSSDVVVEVSNAGNDLESDVEQLSHLTRSLHEVSAAIGKKLETTDDLSELTGDETSSKSNRLQATHEESHRRNKCETHTSLPYISQNKRCNSQEQTHSREAAIDIDSSSGASDFSGNVLPDWLSTVQFRDRRVINDKVSARGRMDDVDLGVDVADNDENDTEDDSRSTSTLTDETMQSASDNSFLNIISSHRSGTTSTRTADDPSGRQQCLINVSSNDSNFEDCSSSCEVINESTADACTTGKRHYSLPPSVTSGCMIDDNGQAIESQSLEQRRRLVTERVHQLGTPLLNHNTEKVEDGSFGFRYSSQTTTREVIGTSNSKDFRPITAVSPSSMNIVAAGLQKLAVSTSYNSSCRAIAS